MAGISDRVCRGCGASIAHRHRRACYCSRRCGWRVRQRRRQRLRSAGKPPGGQ